MYVKWKWKTCYCGKVFCAAECMTIKEPLFIKNRSNLVWKVSMVRVLIVGTGTSRFSYIEMMSVFSLGTLLVCSFCRFCYVCFIWMEFGGNL